MAIIKANAYGHGTVEVARALPDASAFGVACMEEAIALREAGFDRRIVLLEGLFAADDIALIDAFRLDVVVHHDSQVDLLAQGRLIRPVNVWSGKASNTTSTSKPRPRMSRSVSSRYTSTRP